MKKRIFALLICVLMISSLIAGCGQSNTNKPADGTAAPDKTAEKTADTSGELSGTFTYWSCFSGDSMIWDQGRVDSFNAENPNVKCEVQFVTDSAGINNGKLLAAIAGGNAPDLIIADDYSSAYSYAANGSFESWEPYLEFTGLSLDDFIKGYQDVMYYDGVPYLIPQDGNALMLYYNVDMFKEAGLDPNNPPTTLAQLDEYADKLSVKDASGNYTTFGYIPWLDSGNDAFVWPFFFGNNVYDQETKKLTITEQNVVDTYEWMRTYAQKYNPEKIQAFVSGAGGMFSPDHPFMTGKVAMTLTGNWFTNALRIYAPDVNYKVAPVPVPAGGRANSTTVNANVFGIPKGAKNPELAAYFLKYAMQPAVNATNFDEWRSVPTIDAAFDEISWTKAGDEIYLMERKLVNSPDSGMPALCKVSAQLSVDINALRDNVIYNNADPLPLLQALQDKMQAELDK